MWYNTNTCIDTSNVLILHYWYHAAIIYYDDIIDLWYMSCPINAIHDIDDILFSITSMMYYFCVNLCDMKQTLFLKYYDILYTSMHVYWNEERREAMYYDWNVYIIMYMILWLIFYS